jgi:hypothetical protein
MRIIETAYLILSMLSIILIMAGWHNIDLAWNISNAPDCMDYNGHIWQTKDDLHRSGSTMIFTGLMGLILFISLLYHIIGSDYSINLRKV